VTAIQWQFLYDGFSRLTSRSLEIGDWLVVAELRPSASDSIQKNALKLSDQVQSFTHKAEII